MKVYCKRGQCCAVTQHSTKRRQGRVAEHLVNREIDARHRTVFQRTEKSNCANIRQIVYVCASQTASLRALHTTRSPLLGNDVGGGAPQPQLNGCPSLGIRCGPKCSWDVFELVVLWVVRFESSFQPRDNIVGSPDFGDCWELGLFVERFDEGRRSGSRGCSRG